MHNAVAVAVMAVGDLSLRATISGSCVRIDRLASHASLILVTAIGAISIVGARHMKPTAADVHFLYVSQQRTFTFLLGFWFAFAQWFRQTSFATPTEIIGAPEASGPTAQAHTHMQVSSALCLLLELAIVRQYAYSTNEGESMSKNDMSTACMAVCCGDAEDDCEADVEAQAFIVG